MNKKILMTTVVGSLIAGPVAYADETGERPTSQPQQIANQTERAVKDAWLDGKLETALLFNEHLNSFDIDTDVKNGVAYLSGAVESDIDRDLAGEIAESIKGVNNVENNLVVDAGKAGNYKDDDETQARRGFKQTVSNATLTARIKSELLLNPNTAGLAIDVDTRDGQVTLSGKVKSEQEKDLAGKIAGNAPGTQAVVNQLTVSRDS